MNIYECKWMYMNVYDCIWLYMTVYDCIWLYMTVYDCIWLYMTVYDCIWLYMTVYECIWMYMCQVSFCLKETRQCLGKEPWGMGSLRLGGSIKLQVSCAEYRLFYRALLQKETYHLIDPANRSHPILHKSPTNTTRNYMCRSHMGKKPQGSGEEPHEYRSLF